MRRFFPFLAWWPRVNRATLRADAAAALIGAVVVLPQGVAFATLAGMPPEYGLYCAMVPAVVAALFGSSWHAVSGPTNAVSLMVLSALAHFAVPGSPAYVSMALTLSLICGVLMLAMGVFRLGSLVKFVSNGVIVGFMAAVGILIIANQAAPLLGIGVSHATAFVDMVHYAIAHLDESHLWSVAVGALTVATGALAPRLTRRIPPLLIAFAAGTLFAAAIRLAIGAEASGIVTLGSLPSALPPLSLPDLSAATLRRLSGPSLAVTILAVTQAIGIVRSVAIRSGQRVDSNQELIGQGLANIAAAFFSGYPSCASVNRCTINYESGARTPLAAVLSAVFLVVLLLAFAPAAALLPLPVIAGLLVLAGWGLIDFGQMRLYLRTSRAEASVVAVALAATLLMPLEYAILVGVFASLLVYLNRTSRPAMRTVAPDPRHSERRFAIVRDAAPRECPQLKILSIEGSIYFGAVDHVEGHLDTLRDLARQQKNLLIVARNVNFVDVAGAEVLAREARRRRAGDGRLYLQGLRQPVEDALRNSGLISSIEPGHVFRTKGEAIRSIFDGLDRSICARCHARIFSECATLPPAVADPRPDRT